MEWKKRATQKGGNVLVYGRLSFPDLFGPGKDKQGNPTKPGTSILMAPGYDTTVLMDALQAAWDAKWPDPKKAPRGPTIRTPDKVVRDASEKDYKGYDEGWLYCSARCATMEQVPTVVEPKDGLLVAVTDKKQVYPGRWALISVNAFAYSNVMTGVSLGLNNVLLLEHGEVFGGAAQRPESDFDGIAQQMASGESALG